MNDCDSFPRRIVALVAVLVIAGLVVASNTLHHRMADIVLSSEGVIARAPSAA